MKTLLKRIFLSFLFLFTAWHSMAQVQMQGVVLGDDGNELVGALVTVENTSIATLTDSEGNFSILIPEEYSGNKVILFYSGYLKLQVPVHRGFRPYTLEGRQRQTIEQQVINTQMRAQTEVDVPIAVSVISQNKQYNLDLTQIDEMARYVPGFTMFKSDNSHAMYSIRGLSSDGVESYFQQRVAVFMDGISVGRVQASVMEPLDLKSVEVAKGPQGTLFGRGAESGALVYTRNKPVKDTFDISAMVKYGAYNQRTIEGMINTPLSPKVSNRFAVRFNANDGYQKNLLGGRLDGVKAVAVKEALSFFLNDRNTLSITADMMSADDLGACLKTNRVGIQANPSDVSFFTPAELNGDDLGLSRKTYNGIIQYDLRMNDNWTFSNTLGVRYYDNQFGYDSDGCYKPILDGLDRVHGNQISEEARFTWASGHKDPDDPEPHKWTGFFGVSYVREDNTHRYNLNSNLKYLYPVVVGPEMYTKLQQLPALIAGNFLKAMDDIKGQLKDQYPDFADMIDNYLESYKPIANQALESGVSEILERLYKKSDFWDKTPDIVTETANACNKVLVDYINDIVGKNEMFAYIMNQGYQGQGIEAYVESLGIRDMLASNFIFSSIANVNLPDEYNEDMTDRCITNEAGLFADVTWNFAPKFFLTLGARGTYETMETAYSSSSMKAPYVNESLLFKSTGGKVIWASDDYLSWVGRAIINWKFDKTHNLYASASKGRRPGLIYYDLGPGDPVKLKPEILYNYELGIKGISRYGEFQYYAAFYYYDYLNCQSSEYVATNGRRGLVTSDKGKARGFGFDGSLLYTFNKNVSVFMDYAYCHGRFSDKDMDGNDQRLAGKRFRLNPEQTFDAGVNYHRFVGKHRRAMVFAYPSLTTTGSIYFSDNNSPSNKQKTYTLFNCNLGLRKLVDIRNSTFNVDFVLYGKNISNVKYLVAAGITGEAFGFPTFAAGAPATYGLMLRFSKNSDKREVESEGVYYW